MKRVLEKLVRSFGSRPAAVSVSRSRVAPLLSPCPACASPTRANAGTTATGAVAT